MNKVFVIGFLVAISAGILFAGATTTNTAFVEKYSDGSGFAWGTLSHARYSNDGMQYIECDVRSNTLKDSTTTFCRAQDAEGEVLLGESDSDLHAMVVTGVDANSYIFFRVDSSGIIQVVKVSNSSSDVR